MDVTTLVIEAQEARARMQEAKKRIKAEVRQKYEAAMKRDIESGMQEAEIAFAKVLAKVHAEGLSQALLRREVLRTNVWGEWTKWRDLANIEPERQIQANTREQRRLEESGLEWNEDYTILTVTRNHLGRVLDTPVRYDVGAEMRRVPNRELGKRFWPDEVDGAVNERTAAPGSEREPFLAWITAEADRVQQLGLLPSGQD